MGKYHIFFSQFRLIHPPIIQHGKGQNHHLGLSTHGDWTAGGCRQGCTYWDPYYVKAKIKSPYFGRWFGTWILFFHILGIVTPTDELIFSRGVAQPPTSFGWWKSAILPWSRSTMVRLCFWGRSHCRTPSPASPSSATRWPGPSFHNTPLGQYHQGWRVKDPTLTPCYYPRNPNHH